MIKVKEIRLEKIKAFDNFYDNCISIFTKLRDNDERAEKFEREYILCICPGSRAGGNEKRIVEVFWGSRPYEFITEGNNWKSLSENGTTLFFYRNDTGDITITLSPAKTEFRQPIENHIVLYEWFDPIKLNNEDFIKSLWNDFIAYMEVTSLDGKPNRIQRLRINYLRNFKHLVVDGKWRETKFSVFTKEIIKWIITVGLSGTIIYFITLLNQPNSNEIETQLKKVNENLENIINKINSAQNNKENLKK